MFAIKMQTAVMYSNMKVRISLHFKSKLNYVIVCLTTWTSGQSSANVAGSTPLFFALACRMIVKTSRVSLSHFLRTHSPFCLFTVK